MRDESDATSIDARQEIAMGNPLLEIRKYGQSIWYDNIRRGIITSGQLQSMIDDDGLRGITSNPAIFEKAVVESHDYDHAMKALVLQGVGSAVDIYERLAIEDIQWASDLMHGVYDESNGRDGYVSFEVAPALANDTKATVEYARRVHFQIGRENVLIKVPGTPEGMPAITQLIGDGISVNVTLLFAVEAYEACADAYMEGLEKYAASGRNPGRVASVASFFISRIDSLVDDMLQKLLDRTSDAAKRKQIEGLFGRVAVANGVLAYERYKKLTATDRWRALAAKGAQTQRVLWASTSTKNPKYPKTKYVDELIAPDTVNTIPEETFVEYRKSGKPGPGLAESWERHLASANEVMASLEAVGISMKEVTDQLLRDGIKKFIDPFDKLISSIENKRRMLQAA
ncbi:MAG: transaldolase [Thermodesulfobacteriota bacterium]